MSVNLNLPNGLPKYDGKNFKAWQIAFKLVLNANGLLGTLTTEQDVSKNTSGLMLMVQMLSEEKIHLLDNCHTVKVALSKIEEDQAQKTPATRALLLQKLSNSTFTKVGEMEKFITELDDLVRRYRLAGGEYTDQMVISKVVSVLPMDYDATTAQVNNFTTYETLRQMLLERDIQLVHRANLANKMNEEKESDLITRMEALSVHKHIKKKFEKNQYPQRGFRGKCDVCDEIGHKKYDCPEIKAYISQKKGESNKSFSAYVGCMNSTSCNELNLNGYPLDSGSTETFVPSQCQLRNYQPCEGVVSMANGYNCRVTGTGDVITKEFTLSNVKVVPALKRGLVSVAKLTDKGLNVLFTQKEAIIMKQSEPVYRVKRIGDLYPLNIEKTNDSDLSVLNVQEANAIVSNVDWHARLGHPGEEKIKVLNKKFPGKFPFYSQPCTSCKLANMKQGPYHSSHIKSTKPLELVHIDLAGPHNQDPGYDGTFYFVVLVDDFSRFTKVYPIASRNETLVAFKRFRQLVESHTDHRVKKIRTDQARELLSSEFNDYLQKERIWHQKSTAHVHQQNGVAERAIQSIRNKARANLTKAGVPQKFWPEAVMIAAHQMNLLPHTSIKNEIPYVRMFGQTPEYDILREFGSTGFVWLHETQRESVSKFGARSIPCIFMGYQEDMKAYRLWDPVTKKMYKTCNADITDGRYFDWKNVNKNESEMNIFIPQVKYTEETDASQTTDESYEGELTECEPVVQEQSMNELCTSEQPVRCPSLNDSTRMTSEHVETNLSQPRRSSRSTKGRAPDRYGEWACNCELQPVAVPENYDEMLRSPYKNEYLEAMNEEWQNLIEKKVFTLIDEDQISSNTKVITTKWIFNVKLNPKDQSIERFKARIVARGFLQRQGVDFEEIFAPVVSHTTIRCFLVFAASMKMNIHHIDIKTAFLNSKLDKRVTAKPPPGLGLDGQLLILDKALYGLRQAPKCWNEHFDRILKKLNFSQSKVDRCIYVNHSEEGDLYLLLYVDDCLLASVNRERIEHFKKMIGKEIKLRDLGEVCKFNGLNIEKDAHGHFIVSQDQYIRECMMEFELENTKTISKLPQVETLDLNGPELDQESAKRFRALIGSLLYIANVTRPDVCFAVNYLSRFMKNPNKQHWVYAKKVLIYVHSTINRRLHLGKFNDSQLIGFADASYAMNPDFKSQSGMLFTLFGSIVSWSSKKQETTSKSTTEAEYVALSMATDECLWIKELLMDWGLVFTAPTPIYEDNQPVIKLVHHGQVNTRAKHLSTKLRFIHECITHKNIDVKYVATCDQWADMLTKAKVPSNIEEIFYGLRPRQSGGVLT